MMRNNNKAYGSIAILLHWSMAVLIPILFVLGLYMTSLTYYDPNYNSSVRWHESLGIVTLGLLGLRYLWRLANPLPQHPPSMPRWQQHAARLVHWSFYFLLAVVSLSGYFISTAEGQGIAVWNWFEIPAVADFETGFANTMGELHWYVAILVAALFVVHSSAALYHHYVLKDNILTSITKGVDHEK